MKNKGFSDELEKQVIDKIRDTYGFYHQKYVIMSDRFTKTVGHYYTDAVIESHLDGKYALAVFSGEKVTKFISVDIDEGGKKAVRSVMKAFEELGIPRDRIYISTSGRKGYHVDIFFSPWLYNEKAKNLYDLMMWKTGLNPKKVEFRPTYSQSVKVPLGVHATTGNRCWYLDRDTLEPIEDFGCILDIEPIDRQEIQEILRKWNKKRWNELYADMICNDVGRDEAIRKDLVFDSAYYEAHKIEKTGTRHNTFVEIACDLRHYGANKFQIQKALTGFYYKQDPFYIDTSEKECLDDIDEIAKWAEESVPVWKQRDPIKETKRVIFGKDDINYILIAPTSAARKVAFLIWSYCKMFGAAHLSYDTIAKTVGCSAATVKTAVAKLIKCGAISRKSGGCHYRNGIMLRQSNTYFLPTIRNLASPAESELTGEEFEVTEKVNADTFESLYFSMLSSICKPEYLSKYLTRPELDGCIGRCG